MAAYARPTRLQDALTLRAQGGFDVLAGGTDFYPAHVETSPRGSVLDITALRALRGIAESAEHWRIGATTTWTEVLEARLPPLFDCLKLAAREIGGQQIQNAATVAGNLCNASPAADGVPALLALDAQVELASLSGTRRLALSEFVEAPRRTALRPDELLSAIVIPRPRHAAKSGFLKLGARKYLVISIAMVAAVIEHADGVIQAARVAAGACSPVARRLPALERALAGERPGSAPVRPEHLEPLSPIDDVRGSAAYRREAVLVLLRRVLEGLA
jgi:CO/xanthine dehydrogenase FAD-binding subunit